LPRTCSAGGRHGNRHADRSAGGAPIWPRAAERCRWVDSPCCWERCWPWR
jgi:hypothetical protein